MKRTKSEKVKRVLEASAPSPNSTGVQVLDCRMKCSTLRGIEEGEKGVERKKLSGGGRKERKNTCVVVPQFPFYYYSYYYYYTFFPTFGSLFSFLCQARCVFINLP